MKQRVIIIGQGYTGRLSIARSVAELGCEITIVALVTHYEYIQNKKKKPLDAYSKYVSELLFCENYNEKMLVDLLLDKCIIPGQKSIVFPDNDFSAAAVDNNREKLKDYFLCPHIHEQAGMVEQWMDKTRQKALAKTMDLSVVDGITLNVRDKSYVIPDNLKYPCFVKPLRSIVGGKSGLKRCNDLNDLRNHINEILDKIHDNKNRGITNVHFLIEEYKTIYREFAALGFSDGEQVIIPGILEILQIGHGSHFGVAVQGRIFPIDSYEELVEKFKRFVHAIGFVGIFDIDFFESDDRIYFCELNLRFGGSGYAYTKMGVNLPAMMIKSFLGEDFSEMKRTIDKDRKYFNERMAIDDWYSGYLTTKEFMKIRSDSVIKFMADAEDPAPQKALEKEFRIKQIKKKIKQWIGRK